MSTPARPHVIGVVGSGPSAVKSTSALLDDFVAAKDTKFVFPGTVPEFSLAVKHVADWALKNDHEMVFLVDSHDQTDLDDYGTADLVLAEVADVRETLIDSVDTILVAWDEKDEGIEPLVETALRNGTPCLDLTAGLFPLSLDESEPEVPQQPSAPAAEETPAEPAEAKPAPKPRASRAAKNATKAQAAEVPAFEITEPMLDLVADKVVERLVARLTS